METEPIVVDPDPRGILSRPYRLRDWGRGNYAHPQLAEGYIIYPHEAGCYPRSCVPRFVDVGNHDPVALALRQRQERQALLELRSNVPRLVDVGDDDQEALALRQRQERQALLELAPLSNPDVYPWREGGDAIHTPGDINLFYWVGPISRPRWELECYRAINSFCYLESSRPPGARTWCYVCRDGHPHNTTRTNPPLAKCMICIDVYMCYQHRIFLACLGPEGGYPVLEESALMSYHEYWEDPDVESSEGLTD
eukprot:5102622-Amphidinium_carterae.1